MLKINKLTDYATLIMSYLAVSKAKIASTAEISRDLGLGQATVSKLLKILCQAELITSFRGSNGGYQLARSSEEISLIDIIAAIEGKMGVTECCTRENLCGIDTLCSLKDNWKVINNIILMALKDLSLKDMLRPLPNKKLNVDHLKLRNIPVTVQSA